MFTEAETETLKVFPRDVTVAEFAALLGINRAGVYDLIKRNILVASSARGRVAVAESLRKWGDHMRAMAAKNAAPGEGSLASERAALARVQRREVEIRNARSLGEYVPLTDVTDGWAKVAQIVRAQGLAQTSRIGAKVPHLTAHDRAEIAALNREMLEAISEEVAALQVIGSAGGHEFTSSEPVKAEPRAVEVKVPSSRGRPQGVRDSKPRAKRRT